MTRRCLLIKNDIRCLIENFGFLVFICCACFDSKAMAESDTKAVETEDTQKDKKEDKEATSASVAVRVCQICFDDVKICCIALSSHEEPATFLASLATTILAAWEVIKPLDISFVFRKRM